MRFPRLVAVSAATLLGGLPSVTGCGGSGDSSDKSDKRAIEVKTGTLEELAAMTTCKPDVQVDADELRQGVCKTSEGRYVLTTFRSGKGQQDWLREAQSYGGSYLVGKKWVAVGEPDVLGTLRGRLGGKVETASHSGGAGHGGGEHSDSGGSGSGSGSGGHEDH